MNTLQQPIAWLDIRTAGMGWQNRIVATNPQYVENNGPENFAPLYASSDVSADILIRERLEEALGIIRAIFDASAEDPSLVIAIQAFIEGEKRRSTSPNSSGDGKDEA
jgi:hypothetical protein